MEDSIEILNIKRNVRNNKEKFGTDLRFICELFKIDGRKYLKQYDKLGEEMIDYHIQIEVLKRKVIEIEYKLSKLQFDFLSDNNIDIKEELIKRENSEGLLDDLYKSGFLGNELYDIIKTYFWNNRKVMNYELPKWKQSNKLFQFRQVTI